MTLLIRRSPNRALASMEPIYRPLSLFDEMEKVAREAFDTWNPAIPRNGLTTGMDVYEEKGNLVVKAEFPGISKKDINIGIEDDTLTITAEKKPDEISEEATYYTCERSYGEYSRSVSFPFPVDTENVSASFKNGLLEVKLARAEEAKSKRIEVTLK